MFNQVLAVVLLAMTAYGLVQGIRLKKLSEFARAVAGLLLLAMLLRKGGQWLTLAGLASLVLQRYLAIQERRRSASTQESSEPTALPVRGSALASAEVPPEDVVSARPGFQQLQLPHGAATLSAEGGELVLEAGVLQVQLQLSRAAQKAAASEIQHLRAELRFADADGRHWQVDSYFSADLFCADFEDDERRAVVHAGSGFKLWRHADPAWKAALHERCLLAGAETLLDSRMYFDVTISGEVHNLGMKYQGPRVDVGSFGSSLIVRVSGLYEWRRVQRAKAEADDYVPLEPFAWLTRSALLLCFQSPQHYATFEEADELSESEERAPFIAKPLSTSGQPQSHVRFRARPAA